MMAIVTKVTRPPRISAPIVEEGAKGLFLVGLLIFRRRELDGVVDGIVYAGLTAAGFAFTENILYLGRALLTMHSGEIRLIAYFAMRDFADESESR